MNWAIGKDCEECKYCVNCECTHPHWLYCENSSLWTPKWFDDTKDPIKNKKGGEGNG